MFSARTHDHSGLCLLLTALILLAGSVGLSWGQPVGGSVDLLADLTPEQRRELRQIRQLRRSDPKAAVEAWQSFKQSHPMVADKLEARHHNRRPQHRPGGPDAQRSGPNDRSGMSGQADRPGKSGRADLSSQTGPLTAQQVQQMFDVLQEISPKSAQMLKALQQQDARRFQQRAQALLPRIQKLLRLKQQNPATYQLTVREARQKYKVMRIAATIRHYRQQDDPEQLAKLKQQLHEALKAQFQSAIQLRQAKLKQMREQLESAESKLQQMQAKREQIINAQLHQLTQPRREAPRSRRPTEQSASPDMPSP